MLLKRKIPIAMISLVSIPLIFLSIIIYTYTSSALIETSKNRIRNIAEIESEQLSSIIYSQKKMLRLVSRMDELTDVVESYEQDALSNTTLKLSKEVHKDLRTTLLDSPGLENIFVADAKGNMIISANDQGIDSNVSDKLYFKNAMEGKTEISNIVQSDFNKENLVVMTTPIRDSANCIIGILGNNIKLEYFKSKIAAVKMENQGYAYIVDAEGIIIAHPDASRVGTDVQNEMISNIVKKIHDQAASLKGEGNYTYQGKEKYMAYSVIKDLNWLIIFAQEKTEMNKPAIVVLGLITITTLSFIILSLIISMEFSNSITEPITELTETMNRAAAGNLNATCHFESKDEFGQLSQDFNSMLNQLNLNYEELTAVYEELTATEEELRAQYEELQESEEYLRRSEEKYKLAIDGANDAIWEWEHATRTFHISDKWNDMMGIPRTEELSINNLMKLVHKEDAKRVIKNIKEHIADHTTIYKSECRIKFKNENYKWVLIRGKASRDKAGEIIKIAGSVTDISERKEIEDKMKYLAYYDTLTKLPNRILFMEKLNAELKRSQKESNAGAVMFIDLDNFKNINDTLGHDYGDRLLELIAEKFKTVVKDKNTVCRFGGDEFLILRPKMQSEKQVAKLASLLLNVFEEPFLIKDKYIYTTASIGIAIYSKDGENTSTILKNADTAMYSAKALGKNRYSFFNHEMCYGLERKTKIETILRQALIHNNFEIYYQPQIDVKNTKIAGFEALLRLNSEEIGWISPKEFIPIAEECGLIKEIGEWCLRNACLQNKKWKDAGYQFGYIAVNISTVQLQQNNFKEIILQILKETNLKPEFLEIEITESILMQSLEKNIETLEGLKDIGVKIALDDFGTGYSSFNYLRRLPINTLKIDKTFIDGICSSRQEQAIAHGIIQLAHQMSLKVIAEGVETQEQLAVLKAKECDQVQGYFFSKPVSAGNAEELMMKNKRIV